MRPGDAGRRIREPEAFAGPVRLMIPNQVVERASLGPAPGIAAGVKAAG